MEIPKPVAIAVIVIVVVLAVGIGWYYLSGTEGGGKGNVPTHAYPQPQQNQPGVKLMEPSRRATSLRLLFPFHCQARSDNQLQFPSNKIEPPPPLADREMGVERRVERGYFSTCTCTTFGLAASALGK